MAVKYKIDGEHVSALYVFLVFLYVIFFTMTITVDKYPGFVYAQQTTGLLNGAQY